MLAHRLSAGCPRFAEAVVPVPRRGGRACVRAAWLAVPAGVGFGDGEAEGFEFGDELAQAAAMAAARACWAGVGDTLSLSQPGSPVSRISLSISAAWMMLMLSLHRRIGPYLDQAAPLRAPVPKRSDARRKKIRPRPVS